MSGFQRKTDAELSKMSPTDLSSHYADTLAHGRLLKGRADKYKHEPYEDKVRRMALRNIGISTPPAGQVERMRSASESRREYAASPGFQRKTDAELSKMSHVELIRHNLDAGDYKAKQGSDSPEERSHRQYLVKVWKYKQAAGRAGVDKQSKKSFAKYGNAGKPKPIKRQRVVERLSVAYGGDVERAERAVAIYEKHNGAAMWGMAIAAGDATRKSDEDDVHAAVQDTLHTFRTANFDPHDGEDTKHAKNTDPFFVNAPGVSERRLMGRKPDGPDAKIGQRPSYSMVRENAADFLRSLGRHVNESHGMSNRGPITRLEIDASDADVPSVREAVSRRGGYVSHVTNGKVFADIDEAGSTQSAAFHKQHADLNNAAAKAHLAAMKSHGTAHKNKSYNASLKTSHAALQASKMTRDNDAVHLADLAHHWAQHSGSTTPTYAKRAAGNHEHAADLHTKTAAMHAKKAAAASRPGVKESVDETSAGDREHLVANKPSPGDNGYIVFYGPRPLEIYAKTTSAAYDIAIKYLKVPKSKTHLVRPMLAEKPAGTPYTHTADF